MREIIAAAKRGWVRVKPGFMAIPLAPMHRVVQALQRGVEGRILLGEAEAHHRGHGILFVERRYRNRRDFVIGDDAPAEGLVALVEAQRRKVDGEEIRALRAKNREADALQSPGEPVAASRQILAHLKEVFRRL